MNMKLKIAVDNLANFIFCRNTRKFVLPEKYNFAGSVEVNSDEELKDIACELLRNYDSDKHEDYHGYIFGIYYKPILLLLEVIEDNITSGELLEALKNGAILEKYDTVDSDELSQRYLYLFYENKYNLLDTKGWNSYYNNPEKCLLDIFINPSGWVISEFTQEDKPWFKRR